MNDEKPLTSYKVLFHAKSTTYLLSTYMKFVPLIPPLLSYKMEIKVEEILNSQNIEDEIDKQTAHIGSGQIIRVFVIKKGQIQPVVAATINMPATELPMMY